jgi:hypothetical protein
MSDYLWRDRIDRGSGSRQQASPGELALALILPEVLPAYIPPLQPTRAEDGGEPNQRAPSAFFSFVSPPLQFSPVAPLPEGQRHNPEDALR